MSDPGSESTIFILQTRVKELEEQQREDVALIRQASVSLHQSTEIIRSLFVVFDAARKLQERFGACVASYDADGNPTEATEEAAEAIHPAAEALFHLLDAFAVPAREELAS